MTSQRRSIETAALKLVDVTARGGFVLTATFGLPLSSAGQFGMVVLMVSLFAFAANFERQIDIQRRAVGEPAGVVDRLVTEALKFSVFNWVVLLPIFAAGLAALAKADWQLVTLSSLVVVAEHLSNQGYYYALIDQRYRQMLTITAVKNSAMVAIVLYQAIFVSGGLEISFVLSLWASASAISVAIKALLFHRLRRPTPRPSRFRLSTDVLSQHRASLTHFLIGLVAVVMMQYDRLVVGALMPLDQVGIYFRHQVLIALAYQVFSVVSAGRILPTIFALAKHQPDRVLIARLRMEYLFIFGFVLIGFGCLWTADALTGSAYSAHYNLNIWLIGLMLVGFLLRFAADFWGLILNARMRERVVLRLQFTALLVGGLLMVVLTYRFGMWGTAVATVATSLAYLLPAAHAVLGSRRTQDE